MTCREIELLLAEYADGRLGDVERKMVEDHLQSCTRCREELSGIEEMFAYAAPGFASREEAPEGYFDTVWPKLYSRIQEEKLNEPKIPTMERVRQFRLFRSLGTFQLVNIVLIVIVGFSLYLVNLRESGSSTETLPQMLNESIAVDTSRTQSPAVSGTQTIPEDLAASGTGSESDPLAKWGQYLDPEKQRQMYESLTDYLAEVVIKIG